MGNYTLNPSVITAQGNQMPQFNNQAQYIQPTALAGQMPFNSSVANGSQFRSSSFGGSGLVGSLIGAGAGLLNGIFDRKFEKNQAEIQRDWNDQMLDKQNQWNLDMWNMTNEYNTPLNQVNRLREAGLNPLYYGLDGTSANAMQSSQALGYDRASARGLTNPIGGALEGFQSMRTLDKDIELKNAEIDKIKADTANTGLDTEFKERTMDARVESERLGNLLTEENIGKVQHEKKQILANIDKLIAETKTEEERKELVAAQTMVQKATEKEIVELLPYRKLLMSAQTQAQKAAASASYYNAMYTKGLIDSGYIDNMNQRMTADIQRIENSAKREEALAAKDKWLTAIKTGEVLHSDNAFLQGVYDNILNYPLKFLSVCSEVIGDFSPALLLAGAGKVLSGTRGVNKGKSTTLYNADGTSLTGTDWMFGKGY